MEIMLIISCVVIAGLIITILIMSDKIDDLKNGKKFYEDLYYHHLDDCDDLCKKIDEYDKIFENIKSQIPF